MSGRTRVTFLQTAPAEDMTGDEVVAWLLGVLGETSLGSGLLAAWTISKMVDSLKEGTEVPVQADDGPYVLTVTVTGRWPRRKRTYHARER